MKQMRTQMKTMISILAATAAIALRAEVITPSGTDDAAAIQAAIDDAPEGGTVMLGDGEFKITSQIEISRNVTLKSQNGRGKTTIRQTRTELPSGVTSLANRVLYLNHANAVADGLTLTGGKALGKADATSNGAGVKIDSAGGRLLNCDVCGNTLINDVNYGGVCMLSAAGVVSNCLIRANGTTGSNSNVTGLYAEKGLVTHCDVFCNTNTTSANGDCSGVQLGGAVRLTQTAISNNVYGVNGKGSKSTALYVGSASAHVDNCLVANNWSGVACYGTVYISAGTMTNCTIVGNYISSGTGAGVVVSSGNNKNTALYGCVIAGNLSDRSPDAGKANGNYLTLAHCVSDVELSTGASVTVVDCTTGDIRFNADYSLAFDSIGFNRCPSSDYADIGSAVDFYGRPRFSGSAVEAGFAEYQLGAYEPLIRQSATELPENTTLTLTVADPPEFSGTVTYAWQLDGGPLSAWTSSQTTNLTAKGVGAHIATLHTRVNGDELATTYPVNFRVSVQYVYVTDTATDLQSVIDAAGVGTTIVLDDGTYELPRELFIRKPIVFTSRNGAAATTLVQAQTECPSGVSKMQARLLTIADAAAVVDGLTLTGGHWLGSNLNETSSEYGSAVRIEAPGGTLRNCRIVGNKIGDNQQAAVYVSSPDALISNCCICANTTHGGNSNHPALVAAGGLITHCDISCNTNSTTANGHGIAAHLSGYAQMSHCTLTNNVYWNKGAQPDCYALFVSSVKTTVDNCLIANNASETGEGGSTGVYVAGGGTLRNCTITGNRTRSSRTSGLRCYSKYTYSVINIYGCVVSGNESGGGVAGDWTAESSEALTVTKSLSPSGFTGAKTTTDCITATAVFADAAAGDYRLATESEGIDECPASDYTAAFLAAGDLAGRNRLSGDGVDMGAFERQQASVEIVVTGDETKAIAGGTVRCTATILGSGAAGALCAWSVDGGAQTAWGESKTFDYVPQTVGDHVVRLYVKLTDSSVLGPYEWNVWCAPTQVYVAKSGNVPTSPYDSWEKAASDIATAIAVAAGGTTVTVGDGLYEISEQLVLDRSIVLKSRNGAAVTEVRNTVQVDDVPCRLVLINHAGARCEGFTLSNGYSANSSVVETRLRGAGVMIGESGGTLASCTITNCVVGYGNQGTVALVGSGAVVTNCLVSKNRPNGNTTWAYGIGVWMSDGLVVDSRITDNASYLYGNLKRGGTVCLEGGRMTRCVISGNVEGHSNAADCPGTVYISGATTQLDNCLVADNDGRDCAGAGIYAMSGKILNCTVVRNSGKYESAGIHPATKNAVIRNCLVQDNVFKVGATSVTTNLSAASYANVSYCLSPDPMPANKGNVTGTVALRRDDRPKSRSLATDAGSDEGYDCGTLDLARNPRVCGRAIDIGCHEVPNLGLMLLVR